MGIKSSFFIFVFTFLSCAVFAQQEYERHTVLAGETVYSIAKTYQISEEDLLKYNPDIAAGLKEGVVLIIPKKVVKKDKKSTQQDPVIYHTVQPKETIYGLCKQYNCTEEELLAANPDLKDGLKVGATIIIPSKKSAQEPPKKPIEESGDFYTHVVEPKETVYSICKAAGITEEEFLRLNPEVKEKGLQIGQSIRLPKNTVKEELPTDKPSKEYDLYKVLEGDNLKSIAAKFNTTVEELQRLNPELREGLVVGKYIVVPLLKAAETPVQKRIVTSSTLFWHVPKGDERVKFHFAVALPLYTEQNDSIQAGGSGKVNEKSKIGLQFLAGFIAAMDTLSGLGYEIEVDIYDTQNDPDVVRSIARKINKDVDAIFGPLYSANAEILARMLPNVPIISPLSKTLENGALDNLINCVANLESEFLAMASFVKTHPKARVVFVNANKKGNRESVKKVRNYLPAADSSRIVEYWPDGQFSASNHLTPNVSKNRKTLLIVVDQNPAFISDMFTKLKNFNDSSVIIVTTSKVYDINTLENSYLNNQSFVGLSPDFVNYSDSTTTLFIQKYRVKTGTEPSKYGFYGYDTGLYFTQLLAAKGDLKSAGSWPKMKGTGKGFYFTQKPGAGAENNFIYQLRIRNFELLESKQ